MISYLAFIFLTPDQTYHNGYEIVRFYQGSLEHSSDRPLYPSLGLEWVILFLPYNETWRRQRKLFHEEFKPQTLAAYEEHQKESVHAFLRTLATEPNVFRPGIRQ